jgi:ATP-binding cassette subfamily B protein
MDVREVSLSSLRQSVTLVSDTNEIFAGTVEENILLGREIPHEDMQWALELTQLADELSRLPEGLQTELIGEGRNLSRGQIQRLLIARAIVGRPKLLILDEAFTGIDENDKLQILSGLFAPENKWTILDISHDPEVVTRSTVVHVLSGGQIAETGSPAELAINRQGLFASLFPTIESRSSLVSG